MKKVKNAKKNTRKNNNYNGKNVYGQPCVEKFVKLEKETALDQYLTILADIENANGKAVEYTVDSSCFTREEAEAFGKKVERIMELRARLRGIGFVTGACQISA